MTQDIDIISALENEPNDEGGLSAPDLKAKFDESGNTIKAYINGTLIPDIAALVSDSVAAAELAAGNLPNGGTEGQMLVKRTDTDYDLVYVNVPTNADTLTTPRLMQTELSSSTAIIFDGSADVTPGVRGILPTAHGGTGADSAVGAALSLGRGLGSCDTVAATAAKEVTVEGFALLPGAVIGVRFEYANTAENPTLNINGTGAAAIIDSVTNDAVHKSKMAAHTHFFQYDGAVWIVLNPTEWKYVTGTISSPWSGAQVTLGFTPSAVICQSYNAAASPFISSVFAGIQPGVAMSAKNVSDSTNTMSVTTNATGFYLSAQYAAGTMRYVAFA